MLNAGLKKQLIEILINFGEMVYAELGDTVTENDGITTNTRPINEQDRLDFIRSEWSNTLERLSEIGIDIEEAPEMEAQEPVEYIGKCEHCKKINEVALLSKIKPKYCMECGKPIHYQSNHIL